MTKITNVRDRSDLLIADLLDLNGEFAQLSGRDLLAAIGFEKGFNEAGDIITETKDGFPLNKMWTEFQRTIAMWNAQRDPLVNLFTFQVSDPIEGVRYPVEEDFQEASEFGVPVAQRLGPSFRMGYDFRWYDLAIRYTWMFLIDASRQQLEALNNQALEADSRLMFTRVMRAVFRSVTRVAVIDEENINVYPFYNGDTMVPPKWKNTTHSTGHQHYLQSGATTVDSEDVDAMIAHVTHHGYTNSRGYRLVLLVNAAEGDLIRGFNRTDSDKYDFIPSANVGGGVFLPSSMGIIGQPSLANLPGLMSIGTYGPVTVVEEDYIPAGYMVLLVTGGEQNLGNPIGIREHESVRGLRLVKGRDNDYPLMDSYYVHGLGTGVRHRGGGVVMEITDDGGGYDPPEDYV